MSVVVNITQGTFSGLRTPDWGDTIIADPRTKFRRNLSGKLLAARPAAWVNVDTFHFSVSGLSQADIDNMLLFFAATRGTKIVLTDYAGGQWTGIVVQDPKSEQYGPGCSFRLTVAIEGVYTPP